MSRTYLIPTSGEPLPYPGGVLPAKGDWVDAIDLFWRRRLADQDVVRGEPPAAPPSEPETSKPDTSAEPAARSAKK